MKSCSKYRGSWWTEYKALEWKILIAAGKELPWRKKVLLALDKIKTYHWFTLVFAHSFLQQIQNSLYPPWWCNCINIPGLVWKILKSCGTKAYKVLHFIKFVLLHEHRFPSAWLSFVLFVFTSFINFSGFVAQHCQGVEQPDLQEAGSMGLTLEMTEALE